MNNMNNTCLCCSPVGPFPPLCCLSSVGMPGIPWFPHGKPRVVCFLRLGWSKPRYFGIIRYLMLWFGLVSGLAWLLWPCQS